MFALVQPHGDTSAETRFDYEHAAIPCEITHGTPLTVGEATTGTCGGGLGGVTSPEIFADKNVYLAALVSLFLHGSWLHVLGNMLFLWVFGNNVEDRLGHVGFAIFYLFVGLVATLGHVAADPSATVPVVGASGAIAGVMGAYLVFWPRARIHSIVFFVLLPLPAALVLGLWFVAAVRHRRELQRRLGRARHRLRGRRARRAGHARRRWPAATRRVSQPTEQPVASRRPATPGSARDLISKR